MAEITQSYCSPNTITGKVILKESGVGIPDLVVVILDEAPGTKPQDSATTPSTDAVNLPSVGVVTSPRLGSVLTDKDGAWSLTYDDSDVRRFNNTENRPNLQLMVLAPEDADVPAAPAVLFNSIVPRLNSGRTESYMVRITTEQLTKAKIKIPVAAENDDDTESKIDQFRKFKTVQRTLREGLKTVNKEFEVQDLEQNTELRNTVKQVILPNKDLFDQLTNFVKDTDSIKDVQETVYQTGADTIDRVVAAEANNPQPGKGIKITLVLTEEDKQSLQPFKFTVDGKAYYNLPEAEIQRFLFKRETDNGINAILFANNPISKYCIHKTADDKCAAEHTGLSTGHNGTNTGNGPTNGNTTDADGITIADIPKYLEKLLQDKSSNRFQDTTDYKSLRPDEKSVQTRVDSFALQKGPADTTAFYDFHSLQIAFQYVWQQLLDETLVNLTEKINSDLETSGRRGLLDQIKNQIAGVKVFHPGLLISSAENILIQTRTEVPTEIAAAFDISFIEYDALNQEDKTRLLNIAREVNAKELIPYYATYASILRDQGERIIDNIRINKPYTTNQLLKELQEKILSKYEFTVFAADKDYHSINFGLLNTFRQKWEPISYQAGKLVKTIPLSPKEERKFSVKTVQNIKTAKKEAQKNNSSISSETSTTSRAESEIIAKAHEKSNFNMSVKLDFSHISSEVSFGKDAEKDSSQSKKDFREAVIKAAQEFKEERSVEIDTEETINSEYNESGTLVNPNDELSVTYLFYELQRRYRISEQLYRVMPVVMVAQQVPTPDQITEAWIVSNDWIINRVLLDDSFRPTLQYIAQKNVGDDFAIRELRKNLRQQRTLVNNLQLEFSKLKQDVENKYAAMESAIQERINEEHEKRVYRWWWWWDRADRPDTPPDPEMAKALEQAATDEHKYAVEKAEKMALSVQREVNNLHQMTLEYNDAMREHLDRITQTRRLVTHIKNNILYYMQAIWSMEPPDQRYMRLYKVMVPQFEAERTCVVADDPTEDIFEAFREPGQKKFDAWLYGKVKRNDAGKPDVSYKQLVEMADLDTLLGYKGNYMIFLLKEHNALTEFMAAPYIDEAFGAMDPDQLSNVNLEEFSRYICCLHDEDPDEYERLKPVLKSWLERLLSDPLRNGDEIIVPTGSLFIEMLPSDKSLLEDFKLKHREWDVYKVQAEVRKMELENIRYAARLLNAETEDPDVEKKIIVESNGLLPHIDIDNS